jgi:hypothetical protein
MMLNTKTSQPTTKSQVGAIAAIFLLLSFFSSSSWMHFFPLVMVTHQKDGGECDQNVNTSLKTRLWWAINLNCKAEI